MHGTNVEIIGNLFYINMCTHEMGPINDIIRLIKTKYELSGSTSKDAKICNGQVPRTKTRKL